jgi:hypothetical protein
MQDRYALGALRFAANKVSRYLKPDTWYLKDTRHPEIWG